MTGIDILESSSAGPIPERRSNLGELMAPQEMIISLFPRYVLPVVVSTPMAVPELSNRTLETKLSAMMVRLLGGAERYAVAPVTRRPL